MQNFVYKNPTKIIFGKDTIGEIGKEIKAKGIDKVLMIYGKGSILKNGVYDKVIASLKRNGILHVEVKGVKSNPILSKVKEAIEVGKREGVQGILAVGGGSVYDTSKITSIGHYYNGDVWDFYEGKAKPQKALPIFGVLTISATGSEMNSGAVITNEEDNKKWGYGSPLLFPKVSIIDPSIQSTLPKKQTANTAIDTMSHVFELYFDGTNDVDIMREYSEGIIRTAMKHVKVLLNNPNNYESRAQLAWGATLALNGSNGTGRTFGDWSSHNIEHSLSALYDISHGEGLAIVFPAWMRYVYEEDMNVFERFSEKIFNITEGSKEEKILKGIDSLKEFYKSINAPTSLKEIGIKEDELENIAENAAMLEPLGTFKKLYKDDILEILKMAYE